jgi:hypothetical protein
MDKIYDTDSNFIFDKLLLTKPLSQNGNYFIKYLINNYPLYIRPPKSTIKQIVKTNKKSHCDLIFSQENEDFIQWIENLESYSQQIIYKNREQWFETGLELEDIENSFTSPMKTYKSGKFYIIRTNITQRLGKINIKIYNEDELDINIDDVSENSNVMTILEIQGIKCSSKSFQIEIEMKQMMVLNPIDLFEKCILNKKNTDSLNITNNLGKIENTLEETKKENLEEVFKEKEEESNLEKIHNIEQSKKENTILEKKEEDNEKKIREDPNELCEIDINLEEMPDTETIIIKERDDVYYEMYREARRKAKVAKDLALSAYLEAREIKNKYMLDDISDSDESDIDIDINKDK